MLPFPVSLQPGEPPFRQVVYAATKAVVSGMLPAGTAFPSVRELSQALKINPNTAHKIVAELVRNGMLEVMPGLGTVVARARAANPADRGALLAKPLEALLVEARRMGMHQDDVLRAVEARWTELFGDGSTRTRGESNGE